MLLIARWCSQSPAMVLITMHSGKRLRISKMVGTVDAVLAFSLIIFVAAQNNILVPCSWNDDGVSLQNRVAAFFVAGVVIMDLSMTRTLTDMQQWIKSHLISLICTLHQHGNNAAQCYCKYLCI